MSFDGVRGLVVIFFPLQPASGFFAYLRRISLTVRNQLSQPPWMSQQQGRKEQG